MVHANSISLHSPIQFNESFSFVFRIFFGGGGICFLFFLFRFPPPQKKMEEMAVTGFLY